MNSGQWSQQRRWIRIGVALLALALVVGAMGCASLNEHLAMKDAAKAYKAGKYADAAKCFEDALKINPTRAENWKYLAYSYWSLVEPGSKAKKDEEYTDKALAAFQKYLSIVGKDDQIQDYLINLYINQNRMEQGIKYYEGELKKNPSDVRIIQTLSTMYAKMGNFQKSLEYSLMKAKITPNEPAGWLFIGALCWDKSYRADDPPAVRGQIVDQGVEALQTALKLDPNNFNGHLFMNLLYREKSKLAKLAADEERDRKVKRDLLAQADEFMQMADKERDTALAIRKGGSAAPGTTPPAGSASPATTKP